MMEDILISDFENVTQNRTCRKKYFSVDFKNSLGVVTFLLLLIMCMLFITTFVAEDFSDDDGKDNKHIGTGSFVSNGNNADIQLEESNICYSAKCNDSAERILGMMDWSVDPCEDFYQFVCGSYVNHTRIPNDKSTVNMFSNVTDTVLDQLRTIVEEPLIDNELAPFKSMKYLYEACMDTKRIEEAGLNPMKRFLTKLGGWPLLLGSAWNESDFSWQQTIYKFRKHGFSADYLFDLSVLPDFKNTSIHRIQISEPGLSLSREHFQKGLNDTIVNAYYKYTLDTAVMFGADRIFAERELKQTILFEMQLANLTTPIEHQRGNLNKFHHAMSIEEAQQKYKYFNWFEYISNILAPIKVNRSEIIVINTPNYTAQLGPLLLKTPKRVQANYLMWRAVRSSVTYLSENVRNRQLEFSTIKHGQTKSIPRWKECANLACGSYYIASGSMYVKKYFQENSKKEAVELVENIRHQMYDIIRNVDWMDDVTKRNALDKAYAMVNHIAYPEELLDNRKIVDVYKNLNVERGDYFTMITNITKFSTDYSFAKLHKTVNKTDWKTHSQADTVNAMYNLLENSIEFPAGILQGAFFDKDRPKYMNYGAIGFIIGHEITHGFDDQGRQFDSSGNLRDWWLSSTEQLYKEKANCFIRQYGNYTIPEVGIKLNGFNTQGENIADNGGIREAYKAYVRWAKKNRPEPKLSNLLPYTPKQMFWISAASVWCEKSRSETLKYQIQTAVHAPARIRIIGSFSNQKEFSSDFSCPIGSNMNPKIKCKMW